jgi:hypothetical protein
MASMTETLSFGKAMQTLLLMAKSQQNYTVMEKEMLSIVATSEEF